ncbi:MAG: ornithine carbamoyltransferase [Deltaproteobacteria bacterium]|nr:ornithine carbamoyltransferase [Deltaproteobacteria bacterium]
MQPSHLLTLFDWSADRIQAVLQRSVKLKAVRRLRAQRHTLSGRTIALIFEKASTRTRVSFEAGVANLGGSTVVLQSRDTQLGRGEPLKDAARVLGRYVDAIVMRTFAQATIDEIARHAGVPVINGLTDLSHPCQVLADVFTVMERRHNWRSLRWCYIGDGNNMANSLIEASAQLGLEMVLACPDGYRPAAEHLERAKQMRTPLSVVTDPRVAARGADVVITDVWTSMGQEEETQARQKAFAGYQVNADLMKLARPEALVLHCLPAHRGEEISEEVLEGPQSVVFDEAENRMYVQQAALEVLLGVGE